MRRGGRTDMHLWFPAPTAAPNSAAVEHRGIGVAGGELHPARPMDAIDDLPAVIRRSPA
jgi:hypothetical protein